MSYRALARLVRTPHRLPVLVYFAATAFTARIDSRAALASTRQSRSTRHTQHSQHRTQHSALNMQPLLTRALLALCAAVAHAAPTADLVSSLPGWAGQLKSPMYSGYVDVQGMKVHYLFVECESKAPQDAPVLVWSNGGPGASSMFGLFVELGPYVMNEQSLKKDPPTLFDNPYAWTKSGSVLMFDWPPPVGFSYCDGDPTGKGTSCGDWDDDRFSRVAYGALSAWYEKFPEFGGNDLYLTGESYAGIYIPRLAKSILEGGDAPLKARLRGFAVGDACAGNKVNCGGESPWFNLFPEFTSINRSRQIHGSPSHATKPTIFAMSCGSARTLRWPCSTATMENGEWDNLIFNGRPDPALPQSRSGPSPAHQAPTCSSHP